MTSQLRVLVEQPTQGQALGRRRGGLAGSRTGRQDRGRGGREARPLRAAIPPRREARPAGLGARDPDRPRDHRPVPGRRLDRLLGHLVRALAARPRAVRRADLRPHRCGCCARRGPSSTRRPPASRRSSGRASGAAAAPGTGSSSTSWGKRVATSRSASRCRPSSEDLPTPAELAEHRDRFVEAMRAWYVEGKPLGNWTIPYLLRHTAYHVLDHTWEMQDRDLTDDASAG